MKNINNKDDLKLEQECKGHYYNKISVFSSELEDQFLLLAKENSAIFKSFQNNKEVDVFIKNIFLSFLESGEYITARDLLVYSDIRKNNELNKNIKKKFLKYFPQENKNCYFVNESDEFIKIVLDNNVENYHYLSEENKNKNNIIRYMLKIDPVFGFKQLNIEQVNMQKYQKIVLEGEVDVDFVSGDFLRKIDTKKLSKEIIELYIRKSEYLCQLKDEDIVKLEDVLKNEYYLKQILRFNPSFYGKLSDETKAKTKIIKLALDHGDLFLEGLIAKEHINKEVAIKGFSKYYDVWDYLPKELKNDKEVLISYMRRNSVFVELKEDGDFDGQLEGVDIKYLDDEDVVLALMETTCLNFRHVSERIRFDKDFLELLVNDGMVDNDNYDEILNGSLKTDIDFNKMLLRDNVNYIENIDQEFALSKEFLYAIKDKITARMKHKDNEVIQNYYDVLCAYEREDELKGKLDNVNVNVKGSEGRKKKI